MQVGAASHTERSKSGISYQCDISVTEKVWLIIARGTNGMNSLPRDELHAACTINDEHHMGTYMTVRGSASH